MNSPLPASACWHAAVSSGGGVVKVPPRPGAGLSATIGRSGRGASRQLEGGE